MTRFFFGSYRNSRCHVDRSTASRPTSLTSHDAALISQRFSIMAASALGAARQEVDLRREGGSWPLLFCRASAREFPISLRERGLGGNRRSWLIWQRVAPSRFGPSAPIEAVSLQGQLDLVANSDSSLLLTPPS